MYAQQGKLIAHPGKGDELTAVLIEAAQSLKNDPTCRLYVVSRTEEEPEALWVFEVWDSQADHDASLRSDATQRLIQRGRPLIAGTSDSLNLRPVGGKGLNET